MTNEMYFELLADELGVSVDRVIGSILDAVDAEDGKDYMEDINKQLYDYLVGNDEGNIVTSKHVIYRYDITVPDSYIPTLDDLGMSYRELLVWYLFKVNLDFKTALDTVLKRIDYDRIIDWEKDPYGDPINWSEVDNFALDGSKTFINGRRFI